MFVKTEEFRQLIYKITSRIQVIIGVKRLQNADIAFQHVEVSCV